MTFNYSTTHQGGMAVFKLEGEIIEKGQAAGLVEQIERLISSGRKHVVLDLGELRYINSSGLNVLVNILTKMRNAGGDVAVCHLSEKVKSVMIVTKLDTIFHILPTVEEAIKRLKSE